MTTERRDNTMLLTFEGRSIPFVDGTVTLRAARGLRTVYGSPGSASWLTWTMRDTYERILLPIWPLLLEVLREKDAGSGAVFDETGRGSSSVLQCDGAAAMACLPLAIARLADRTSSQDQRALLFALGVDVYLQLGPVERNCRCPSCAVARELQLRQRRAWAGDPLRAAFLLALGWHLEVVLKAPTEYDRSHGAPCLIWRGDAEPHAEEDGLLSRREPGLHRQGPRCSRGGPGATPMQAHSGPAATPVGGPSLPGFMEEDWLADDTSCDVSDMVGGFGDDPAAPTGATLTAATPRQVDVLDQVLVRITRQAWQLLKRDLEPVDARPGAYDQLQIGQRVEGVALHLAFAVVSEKDQRAILGFVSAVRGGLALPASDRCVLCDEEAGQRAPRIGSRRWQHHLFGHELLSLLSVMLARRSPHDLKDGMPLVVEHPRDAYLSQFGQAEALSRPGRCRRPPAA